MNPPFALEKEKEYEFIDHALEQMEDGGLLFSVLPVSIMIKMGKSRSWRRKLLKNNTLLSVITFPPDLFYQAGASQQTVGIFVKKGLPHGREENVLWLRAIHDGLSKKKGKRLPNPKVPNDLLKVKPLLQSFLHNPNLTVKNIPEFQKASPIDFSDKHLELVPEVYLNSRIPNSKEIEEEMENIIRQSVAYLIKSKKEFVFNDQNN